MSYSYEVLDEEEYGLFDDYNDKYFYHRREMRNVDSRNNRNRMVYKNNLTEAPIDIAEVMASIIGKKTIGNVCDCELAKKKRRYLDQDRFDYGVVSYYYYSDNDKLIHPYTFIKEYLEFNGMSKECLERRMVNIEVCIKAIFYYMKVILQRPYTECQKVRQQFIDMIVFDCRYGNGDRNLDNWMLYQDKQTGEIDLYPLFDNESFLGLDQYLSYFQLPQEEAGRLSKAELAQREKELILNYNSTLRMREIVPQDEKKGYSNYEDVLRYLLEKYPEHTLEAYKKVSQFSYYDLENLLSEFPDLPDERKVIVKRLFISRELTINRLVQEYLNRDMDFKYPYC